MLGGVALKGGRGKTGGPQKSHLRRGAAPSRGGNKKKTELTAGLVMASVIFLARPRDSRTNQGGAWGREDSRQELKNNVLGITPPGFKIWPIRGRGRVGLGGKGGGVGASGVGRTSPGGDFCLQLGVFSGLWRGEVDSPRGEKGSKSCWATGSCRTRSRVPRE